MAKKFFLTCLLISGLILRCLGLFYYGNHNFETYREWGFNTRTQGLAKSFAGGYGPFSYLLMGIADYVGAFTPQTWWWPYKAINLIFEIFILILLFKIFPRNKLKIAFLYWLNPWFLIPGAWQGFWDAVFGFFMLLTTFIFDNKILLKKKNYFVYGLFFSLTALVKPQIVAPMVILAFIFFFSYFIKFKFKEGVKFALGAAILPLIFSLFFYFTHRGFLFLLKKYSDFLYYMPYLVNSEINIWHTITRFIMNQNNMNGPIYSLSTLSFPYNLMERGAQLVFFILIIIFIIRNPLEKTKNYFTFAFSFAFMLMPQIMTRSHAYHFYPASLLMIPLILWNKNDKSLLILWLVNIAAHFYGIWWRYGLGEQIGHVLRPGEEPNLSIMGIVAFVSTLGLIKIYLQKK